MPVPTSCLTEAREEAKENLNRGFALRFGDQIAT
jgi:hypothetical protein